MISNDHRFALHAYDDETFATREKSKERALPIGDRCRITEHDQRIGGFRYVRKLLIDMRVQIRFSDLCPTEWSLQSRRWLAFLGDNRSPAPDVRPFDVSFLDTAFGDKIYPLFFKAFGLAAFLLTRVRRRL
jgi:hypothetical protein